MTFRKYLVLLGVAIFAAAGDSMLSHGMKQTGSISLHHLGSVILAVLNPWVAVGIVLLLAFFASYMNALSWADLTYVLPATAISYVLLALVAKFVLHEQVSATRWLGIALISGGVASAAGGPALTEREHHQFPPFAKNAKDGAPTLGDENSPLKPKAGLNGARDDEHSKPPLLPTPGRNGAPTDQDENSPLLAKTAGGGTPGGARS